MSTTTLATFVASARAKVGRTVEQAAVAARMSSGQWRNIEKGMTRRPRDPTLRSMARVLGCHASYLRELRDAG